MHDIRAVRADPAAFDAALARRGLPPASAGGAGPGRPPPRRANGAGGAGHAATRWPARSARPSGAATTRAALKPRRRRCARDGGAWTPRPPPPSAPRGAAGGAAQHPRRGRARWRRTSRPMSCCTSTASRPGFDFAPQPAFRARRGARADGFRHRRQARRQPLHRAERRAGAAGTRARPVDARPAHRASTAIPRPRCRCWSTTRPCTAPASCRNSPRICSAPPMAAG